MKFNIHHIDTRYLNEKAAYVYATSDQGGIDAIFWNCNSIEDMNSAGSEFYDEIYVYDDGGNVIDYDTAVYLMDDDIREEIHREGKFDGDKQGFFNEYCKRHREKYNEDFTIN